MVTPIVILLCAFHSSFAQDNHYYQTDFTKEELAERRAHIMDAIGNEAIALIQGASGLPGFQCIQAIQ